MLYRGHNCIQDYSTKNRRVSGLGSSFGEPQHSPEALQTMKDGIERLRLLGVEAIDD